MSNTEYNLLILENRLLNSFKIDMVRNFIEYYMQLITR